MEIYKDASKSTKERVEDLMSRMTLEEKVAQLMGDLAISFLEDGDVSEEKLKARFPYGHGRFTQYSMVGLADPVMIAEATNKLQDYFVNKTRLGIPVALQSENLCGYPAAGGTLFPAMINLGCTFEPELALSMGEIIGQESRAVGISSAMSPVIDVARDPRWGRTYETFGEDPYVISQFGINYVKGMQSQKVGCIGKHFLGYGTTQGGLNMSRADITDRELYEVYATPFEAADKEAGLTGVMGNYGEIDGQPVIMNKKIATKLLRETMGFEGMLTSDGGAVRRIYEYFKLSKTYEEAGYLAKKAGCDTEIPVGDAFRHLPEYVRSGQLDESVIDDSVRRILTIKFNMGLFENPYCDVDKVREALGGKEKDELSEKIAEDSLVLLKNEGILPLKKGTRIALIGPHADSLRYPISGYTYPAYIEMIRMGSSGGQTGFGGMQDEQDRKNKEQKPEKAPEKKRPGNMFAAMYEMVTKGREDTLTDMNSVIRKMGGTTLKEEMEKVGDVIYARGCDITGEDRSGFTAALEAAGQADTVVLTLGGNCGWVNVTGGEGKDRQTLHLPGVQQELLELMVKSGKKVVLILYGPGVFAAGYAKENTAAMIQAFMPGQFAGKAVTKVLYGDKNPGGKLTMTIPRTDGQIPIFYNHKRGSGYSHDEVKPPKGSIFSGGYVDGSDEPLFAFGHGLSYTSFEITDLETDKETVATDGTVDVSVKVTNTGEREGDEVVQLYTGFMGAKVTRPEKQISGFKRVHLDKGETKVITFLLRMDQLGYYNEDMEFVVEPGDLTLMAGNSSDNCKLKKTLAVTGQTVNILGRRSYTCKVSVR